MLKVLKHQLKEKESTAYLEKSRREIEMLKDQIKSICTGRDQLHISEPLEDGEENPSSLMTGQGGVQMTFSNVRDSSIMQLH